jgi:uncharacterized protein (DUF885 family)
MRFSVVLLTLTLACVSARAETRPAVERSIDDYYAEWVRVHPLAATELGIHDYDRILPDVRSSAEAAWVGRLKFWRAAIKGEGTAADCDHACRIDARAVVFYIEHELFQIERLEAYAREPGAYTSIATEAVFPLIKRSFGTPSARAAAVVERLRAVPPMLREGRARLRPELVSPVSITIALEELNGAIAFIRDDVPRAFDTLTEPERIGVRGAAAEAARALAGYGASLKHDLLPHAKGTVALGAALLAGELAASEMSTEPLDALLARGEAELHRLQRAFVSVAKQIDPQKTALQVKAELGSDHPSVQAVLPEIRARLEHLRRFLVEQHVVDLPPGPLPIVDETPPFMRAITQASMDTPGPYEEKAKEAYFHVTLPDPSWPAARVEDYLAGALNRPIIDVVSIHEAYPGHYVQALWAPRILRRARRMEGVSSNIEGWAHYCEAMMLEVGYGSVSPRTQLAQLADALLRAARYVVTIRMHTGHMSVAEAQRFFVDEGYQAAEVARIESKRAVGDRFFYYTWGKLEILKLRDEMKQKWGNGYSLERFHNAFLAEGPIPLPLLREALLASP